MGSDTARYQKRNPVKHLIRENLDRGKQKRITKANALLDNPHCFYV